ncbi:unnamed protein product [Urochloa humidicola]
MRQVTKVVGLLASSPSTAELAPRRLKGLDAADARRRYHHGSGAHRWGARGWRNPIWRVEVERRTWLVTSTFARPMHPP